MAGFVDQPCDKEQFCAINNSLFVLSTIGFTFN